MRPIAAAIATALLLAGCAAAAPPVRAEGLPGRCAPHTEVAAALTASFAERRAAWGVIPHPGPGQAGGGALIELWQSDEGASWTLLLSLPDGTSCMLAAGEAWRAVAPQVSAPPGIRH